MNGGHDFETIFNAEGFEKRKMVYSLRVMKVKSPVFINQEGLSFRLSSKISPKRAGRNDKF